MVPIYCVKCLPPKIPRSRGDWGGMEWMVCVCAGAWNGLGKKKKTVKNATFPSNGAQGNAEGGRGADRQAELSDSQMLRCVCAR